MAMSERDRDLIPYLLTKAAQLRLEAADRPADPLRCKLAELADEFERMAQQMLKATEPYRMFFRGDLGVCGRQDFAADDDDHALEVSAILADACSDVCTSFELWQGERQVCGERQLKPTRLSTPHQLSERRQAQLVETEEAMRDSRFAIARSRRLLARLAELKPGAAPEG